MSGPGDVNPPAAQAGVQGAAPAGAEKASREIEKQYRALQNNYKQLTDRMREGVLIVQQGEVRYANPAAAVLRSTTLVGTLFTTLVAPEQRTETEHALKQALQNGSAGPLWVKLLSEREAGSETALAFMRVSYGGEDAVQITAEEPKQVTTEESSPARTAARLKEALRQSQRFARALVDSSLDMIMAADPGGLITE